MRTVFCGQVNMAPVYRLSKGLRIFAAAFAVALLLASGMIGLPVRAAADSGTDLAVYKGQSQTAVPFYAENMFPGDRVSGEYNVQVSFTGNLTLHFRSDIRPGYEKLSEVLKCRILIGEKPVYDGLMRDMPARLDHLLSSSKGTTQTLSYDITVYLDTSVGNDYQNQELVCDFRWWVEVPQEPDTPSKPQAPGQLIDPPRTGDTIAVWFLMLVLSGSVLILLLAKRKKEEHRDGEK